MADDAERLRAEVEKLKRQCKTLRQELRKERAAHRQTAMKLEASLAWGRGAVGFGGEP